MVPLEHSPAFPVLLNWARTCVILPPNHITPTSVTELAAAVSAVETGGGVLRAVGSNWSYTEVALTRDVTLVIDASELTRILERIGRHLAGRDALPFALNDASRPNADNLIHVEAGIKIHDLNCALEPRGKAMRTLGGSSRSRE